METSDSPTSPGDMCFANALNEHGYSFCNRIQREAELAIENCKSSWTLETIEHSVEVRSFNTRIDFILSSEANDTWLVCECKRVRPNYTDWFFAKNTYENRGKRRDRYMVEYTHAEARLESTGTWLHDIQPAAFYHIAIPVNSPSKTPRDGQATSIPASSGRDAIEDASTQLCKGVNGLVTYFMTNAHILGTKSRRILIPVLFTTARLFASDADLSESDLVTGNIQVDKLKMKPLPYLFYQYHQTPAIKHALRPIRVFDKLRWVLEAEYIRTIAVVNATYVQEFLCRYTPEIMSSIEYVKSR